MYCFSVKKSSLWIWVNWFINRSLTRYFVALSSSKLYLDCTQQQTLVLLSFDTRQLEMLLYYKACGFRGLCTGNHKTAGVSKCFFFFLISLNSWEWQGTVCSFQWPLDDRATLWAIHSIISPCPPLQQGLNTIKVKVNHKERDTNTL